MKLWGVVGWKNSGKTGLVERLVAEFRGRGFSVSTIKRTHHALDLDQPGTDSFRHRQAGAGEVILASDHRFALMHEVAGPPPTLEELAARLAPVDLILVEGFKMAGHPKIEAIRKETAKTPIGSADRTVRAIAADHEIDVRGLPRFDLNDTVGIADFIVAELWPKSAFDTVFVVDWSAANDRGSKPKKDAIWAAVARDGALVEAPVYLRNREVALAWIEDRIEQEVAAGRRVLACFDFPFGYPNGFARAVTGTDDPLALWDWFGAQLEDGPKGNNRFALAARINRGLPGIGPFWFNGESPATHDGLPHLGRDRTHDQGLAEKRHCETLAQGTFSCWQMGGAGAVGGQVMTGMAALAKLRKRLGATVAVWPFQPADRPVVLAEVWPSLIDGAVRRAAGPDDIRDKVQVTVLACALSRLAASARLDALLSDVPETARLEEGWILGLGHEAELEEAAER